MTTWDQHKGDAHNAGVRRDLEGPLRVESAWTADLAGAVGSPVLDREAVFVGTERGNWYALERESGRRRWVFETSGGPAATPVVARNRVYVATADGTVHALEAATGDEAWAAALPGADSSSLTVADGRLYVGHTAGASAIALALESGAGSVLEEPEDGTAEPGEIRWTHETDAPVVGRPAVGDGDDGQNRFGEPENANSLPDPTADPTADPSSGTEPDVDLETGFDTDFDRGSAASRVFVADEDGTVHALEAATGDEEWTAPTDGVATGGPTVADGLVYVAGDDGTLLALDADSGRAWFSYDIDAAFTGSATVLPDVDTTFVGATDGYLHVTDTSFGRRKLRGWLFSKKGVELDGPVRGSPVVVGDVVCVGDETGSLYGLDTADDCTHLWHFDTGTAVTATPAVGDRQLFVGTEDGRFHCLTWSDDDR
ncbi:Outer membrane protein assembly factor BamB, contains PQQ-like beta-propeller repeat [Halobiforma haloterrestris]|uniref:Outer membrane protein assembly factor BamB, contains PQQ-like beta-propeller repeat n=1 Tax=Natronobacterium haloterrestre TaxID=148448 RepID=A0A1I1H2X6_NATHA|nr:PQQ-binding-like beta-propeller repeat protein [Halobiforma haloterrestris]SFC18377.1 Outer membrane protein assembly factor BamB, contains PQQ-like beta-propeller repeat [Halobiforma haloterrestris]